MQGVCALARGAGLAAAIAPGFAAAIDFDDPDAAPQHFALETLSVEAVTVTGGLDGRNTFYNVRAPAGDATLRTTAKLQLAGSAGRFVRVDLDGMVFSAVPRLRTGGPGGIAKLT